jgi:hypothetical protein
MAGVNSALIRLYPRAWRARYGHEFARLLETRQPSPALFLDVLAGAIDARLHGDYPALRSTEKGTPMQRCGSAAPIAVLVGYATLWLVLTMTLGDQPATNAFKFPGLAAILIVGWSIRTERIHSHAAKALLMAITLAVLWTIAFAGYATVEWVRL